MDFLSDDLKAMMTAWFTGQDVDETIARLDIAGFYASTSWHCLFAGYGTFPDDAKLRAPTPAERIDEANAAEFLARSAMNFQGHAEQLADLRPSG